MTFQTTVYIPPRPTGPSTGGSDGWEDIQQELADAKDGETITIDMNGETEVPGEVWETIAGRDVAVILDMGGNVSWTVDSNDVPTATHFADMDFGVDRNTTGIDVDVINAITGVATGYGDGTFQPGDSITRQEFAQMLYNYAKYKGYDLTAEGDLSQFPDSGSVADWAEIAMSWANGNELINGHDDGTIDAGGTAIRAQAAIILMWFDQNLVKN